MKVQVESKDDIKEVDADGRGRVYVGSEFAGKHVQLAILDAEDRDD
jgi:hypothetical protein